MEPNTAWQVVIDLRILLLTIATMVTVIVTVLKVEKMAAKTKRSTIN